MLCSLESVWTGSRRRRRRLQQQQQQQLRFLVFGGGFVVVVVFLSIVYWLREGSQTQTWNGRDCGDDGDGPTAAAVNEVMEGGGISLSLYYVAQTEKACWRDLISLSLSGWPKQILLTSLSSLPGRPHRLTEIARCFPSLPPPPTQR